MRAFLYAQNNRRFFYEGKKLYHDKAEFAPGCPYKGHIHTAQIDLWADEVPNLREIDAQAVHGCIKNDSYRGQGAFIRSLQFNPNAIALVHKNGPATSWPEPIGDCNALADFEVSIHYWAEKAKVPEKYAHIVRLDFAFDYYGTKETDITEEVNYC